MKVMEKPEVEFIEIVDTVQTSGITCTTEYCNLQGCPEDTCGEFEW